MNAPIDRIGQPVVYATFSPADRSSGTSSLGRGDHVPICPDRFAAFLAVSGLADATIRVYRPMFVRWCDYAISHGHDPYRPDPMAVRAWSKTVKGTRSSLAHARATIARLCAALEVDDVSEAIPLPRKPRHYQPLLTREQATKLVDAAQACGMKGTAVLIGLYTAGRISEIATLRWDRVDFDGGKVTLERPKVKDLHTVPLHPVLRSHLEERFVPDQYWVLPGRNGGHISPGRAREWIQEVADVAGIGKVTPHMLRRTTLTEAYDATGDLRAVQDFAGHTDPAVTATYTRTSEKRLVAAVAAVDYQQAS